MTHTPSEDRRALPQEWQAPPPQGWPAPDGEARARPERPTHPRKPRGGDADAFSVPWHWWDAVMIYVLGFIAAVLTTMPLMVLAREDLVIPLSLTIQGALMLATTLVWIGLRYRGQLRRLLGRVPAKASDALVGIAGGAGAFFLLNVLVGSLLTIIAEQFGFEVPEIQENLRDFIRDPALGWLAVSVTVLLAPIGEELLFRGVLFQSLRTRMPLWSAIALSAILFGLVHYEPLLIVLTTMVGAVLAWLFHLRGTLLVSIVAHAVYNGISVTILLLTAGTAG